MSVCTAHEHVITEEISRLSYRQLVALRLQMKELHFLSIKIMFYSYPHTNNANYVNYEQNFFENTMVKYSHHKKQNNIKYKTI